MRPMLSNPYGLIASGWSTPVSDLATQSSWAPLSGSKILAFILVHSYFFALSLLLVFFIFFLFPCLLYLEGATFMEATYYIRSTFKQAYDDCFLDCSPGKCVLRILGLGMDCVFSGDEYMCQCVISNLLIVSE